MAFTKPSTINSLWATSGTRVVPPSSKRSLGWIAEKPPYQYFNDILYKLGQANAYLNSRGVAEWDNETEYVGEKSYIVGSDGSLYKCLITHTDQNPVLDDGTYWKIIVNGQGSEAWNILFPYEAGALVLHDSELWLATADNTGSEPTNVNTNWDKLVRNADIASQSEVDSGSGSKLVTAETLAAGVFEGLYPIGTIYSNTTNSANPSTYLLGAGSSTWSAVEGRVIVGVGTVVDSRGVSTAFAASETGGETAHVQTEAELAAHNHDIQAGVIDSSPYNGVDMSSDATINTDGYITETGDSEPMNIMQPYQTAYLWVRTA